ncbi:hypothetical protein G7054_g13881 [Neopestalotiopsis clavispora]|nr:hypothetical protein G7054_g13881 [Neopestalotiopsis clavispora]
MSSENVPSRGLGVQTDKRLRGRSPALDDNAAPLYKRLASHKHEIRLLELYERQRLDSEEVRFKCKLKEYEIWRDVNYMEGPGSYGLDNSGGCDSSFAALSWCWGQNKLDVDLIVNGHLVKISRNLNEALNQLWNMRVYTVWVDFLCINQCDEVEKGLQVATMDNIYTRANKVYAWIGSREGDSDLAMELLGSESPKVETDPPEDPELVLDAIIQLLSRSYFTRMWIIQEICLPQNVYFLCGEKTAPFDSWVKNLYSIEDSIPAQYAQHLFDPIRGFRAQTRRADHGKQREDLVEWLLRTRRSKATDARDKLYALMSLASDGRRMILAPNYTQDLLQICRDTTAQMLRVGHRTAVFLMAHRTDERQGWPSWVPNWSRIKDQPRWVTDSLKEARKSLTVPNKVDRRVLAVNGVKVDDILKVFSPSDQSQGYDLDSIRTRDVVEGLRDCLMPRHNTCSKTDFVRTMLMVLASKEIRRPNQYRPHSMRPSQSAIDLGAGRSYYDDEDEPTPHEDKEKYASLTDWLTNYADTKIGIRSVQGHLERFLERSNGAPMESVEDTRKLAGVINQSLADFNRWRMTIALCRINCLQIVYRDARAGDQVFVLSNSPLNVILRAVSHNEYSFIGERYPLNDRLDDPEATRGRVLIK